MVCGSLYYNICRLAVIACDRMTPFSLEMSFSPSWMTMACDGPSCLTSVQKVNSREDHLISLCLNHYPVAQGWSSIQNLMDSSAQKMILWPTNNTFHFWPRQTRGGGGTTVSTEDPAIHTACKNWSASDQWPWLDKKRGPAQKHRTLLQSRKSTPNSHSKRPIYMKHAWKMLTNWKQDKQVPSTCTSKPEVWLWSILLWIELGREWIWE